MKKPLHRKVLRTCGRDNVAGKRGLSPIIPRYQLDEASLTEIRASINKGLAVGAERFKDQIEAVVARSVRPGQAGRRKERADGRLSGEQESLRFEENAK